MANADSRFRGGALAMAPYDLSEAEWRLISRSCRTSLVRPPSLFLFQWRAW